MCHRTLAVAAAIGVTALAGVLWTGCRERPDGSEDRSEKGAEVASPQDGEPKEGPRTRRKLEFTVTQKSSRAVPGSDGELCRELGDITRGRVRMTVLRADCDRAITSTSASEGDTLVFPFHGRRWRIRAKKLLNFPFDDDYGVFVVSRGPAPESPRRPDEQGVIDILGFPKDLDVKRGEPFKRWMSKQGWKRAFGSPDFSPSVGACCGW